MSLTATHGGDVARAAAVCGRRVEDIVDFSANLHPLGPPPGVLDTARAAISAAPRYPSPRGEPLRSRLSERIGESVVLGNGATELLVAALHGARRVVLRAPSYLGYAEAARVLGLEILHGWEHAGPGDVVVVGRPNNPDGHLPSSSEIAALARTGARVVVDESFLAFTDAPSCLGLSGVTVVTSLTKTFAIPGLRLGWAVGIDPIRVPPWTVNVAALAAGLVCLDHEDWPRRIPLDHWRDHLSRALKALPVIAHVDGGANFLLLTLRAPVAPSIRERALRDHGVLVRDASNFAGLDNRHLRVAVRTPAENARLVEALA